MLFTMTCILKGTAYYTGHNTRTAWQLVELVTFRSSYQSPYQTCKRTLLVQDIAKYLLLVQFSAVKIVLDAIQLLSKNCFSPAPSSVSTPD